MAKTGCGAVRWKIKAEVSAGNDTVPISTCRGGGVRCTECRIVGRA